MHFLSEVWHIATFLLFIFCLYIGCFAFTLAVAFFINCFLLFVRKAAFFV